MNATAETKMLTAGELAARWQLPTSAIYRLVREGKLQGTIKLGRYRRFNLAAIKEFEAKGGTGS